MKEVKKAWGRELCVVNREYCGKILFLDKGAQSSLHCHNKKTETFFCFAGEVDLKIVGKHYILKPFSKPKTIKPKQLHSFRGIEKSSIVEFSTHHSEKDVVRLTESKEAE